LLGLQIQSEDMVVDLIRVLVEAAERIDLIVADVRHGSVDEAGRSLTNGGHDGRHIGIMVAATRRVGAA